jgi:hypothetical protein
MSVTFTKGTSTTAVTVIPVPGTLQYGGNHDQRGGRVTDPVQAGLARDGQCQVIVTAANEAEILALASPAGDGDYAVAGDDIVAGQVSAAALVDVNYGEGEDGVEVVTVAWKGTTAVVV